MNKMKQILNTGVFTATEGFFFKKKAIYFSFIIL